MKRLKVSSKEGVQNIYKSVQMIVVWMVNQKQLRKVRVKTLCWDLGIQYGRNRALYEMTVMNLNKADLPEELSHEEVIALKDLDATLLELTTDD